MARPMGARRWRSRCRMSWTAWWSRWGVLWDMGYQWDYKRGDWFLVFGCSMDFFRGFVFFFLGCSGYYNLLTIFSGSQTIEVNHVRYTFCISAIPSCGRRFLARDEPRRRRVTSWHPEISWWSSRWGPVMRWCDGCCPRSQWDDVYCELPWWMG